MKPAIAIVVRMTLMFAFAVQGLDGSAIAAPARGTVADEQSRRQDTLLTARVKGALITDSVTRGHDITIETFRGVIQLSGFVNSDAERTRAAEVAAAVPGVIEVRNAIQVRQVFAERGPERREVTDDVRAVGGALQARNDTRAEQH